MRTESAERWWVWRYYGESGQTIAHCRFKWTAHLIARTCSAFNAVAVYRVDKAR